MKRMCLMTNDFFKAQDEWKLQLQGAAARADPKKETVSKTRSIIVYFI
jgi:hypothetical protein